MTGIGTKLFTMIMAINICFFVILPISGTEYPHMDGDLFDLFLVNNSGTANINTTTLGNDSFTFLADTTDAGGGDSGFIDPLKVVKGLFITLFNFAVTPISIVGVLVPNNPLLMIVFAVPLALLYIISLIAFVRGAQW